MSHTSSNSSSVTGPRLIHVSRSDSLATDWFNHLKYSLKYYLPRFSFRRLEGQLHGPLTYDAAVLNYAFDAQTPRGCFTLRSEREEVAAAEGYPKRKQYRFRLILEDEAGASQAFKWGSRREALLDCLLKLPALMSGPPAISDRLNHHETTAHDTAQTTSALVMA